MAWKRGQTVFDLGWVRHDGAYFKRGVSVRRVADKWIVDGIGDRPQAFGKRRRAFVWAEANFRSEKRSDPPGV